MDAMSRKGSDLVRLWTTFGGHAFPPHYPDINGVRFVNLRGAGAHCGSLECSWFKPCVNIDLENVHLNCTSFGPCAHVRGHVWNVSPALCYGNSTHDGV
jgi:hypothetical protein